MLKVGKTYKSIEHGCSACVKRLSDGASARLENDAIILIIDKEITPISKNHLLNGTRYKIVYNGHVHSMDLINKYEKLYLEELC